MKMLTKNKIQFSLNVPNLPMYMKIIKLKTLGM